VGSLGDARASPALLACVHGLARRTGDLLRQSRTFPAAIGDTRLALEVAVIQTYAQRLVRLLSRRDPLCARVHLGKAGFLAFGMLGLLSGARRRAGRLFPAGHEPQDA
jgi:hydroxysqualene synthase